MSYPEKRMSVHTVVIDRGGSMTYLYEVDKAAAESRAEAVNAVGDFAVRAWVATSEVDTVFCNGAIRDEYQRRVDAGESLIWETQP